MSASRRFPHTSALAVAIVALAEAAWAQTPPLPPSRPTSLDAPASIRSTVARPAAGAPVVEADDYTPVTLPPAPRARMHACGVEWRQKKMNNETGGLLWREFARACLTR